MITLSFSGQVSATQRATFERAATKWDSVLDTSFAAVEVDGATLTDLQIDVSIRVIDGEHGILGQAGPTILRPGAELPVKGVMEFDFADVARLERQSGFEDVILHEMAHVLGFGTLWGRSGFIRAAGTNNPRFAGPAATREFIALINESDDDSVPIANTGAVGTREAHWRELIFGDELLTGFLSGDHRPLSRMSIASFEDLGYRVNYDVADPFELPTFRQLALMGVTEAVRICDLCRMGRPEPVVLGQ